MNLKKHFLEALTLVIAALACAVVANAVASRDRKIALVGNYPNALRVPAQTGEPMPITSANSTRLDTAANEVPAMSTTPPATTISARPTSAPAINPATALPSTAAPPATTTMKIATPKGSPAAKTATPTSAVPAAQETAIGRFSPHEKQAYIELHGDDVAWLYQHGVLVLDARRTAVYEQGHIAGARSFPVWEADADERVNQLYNERGSDPRVAAQPIVVYCSGGDCEDSHMLAQKLWGVQFNNVYVYKDGFPDWEKRSGQIHKGDAP